MTPFGLLIGLLKNLPIVTTINYYNVTGLHTLQALLTIIYSLPVTISHTLSSVALDHRLTSHTAPRAFYTVPCCLVSPALSPVMSQWEALPRHRGGGGTECWLACYRSSGSGGRGALHSANTSEYYKKYTVPSYNICFILINVIFHSDLCVLKFITELI
jgi:hypothetical protein